MIPGNYRIHAGLLGYRPVDIRGIQLQVAQTARYDLVMQVGQALTTEKLSEMRIRDPFILAEPATKTYYLYRSGGAKAGVLAFTSKDLDTWTGPLTVFQIPEGFWADQAIWAPEVHRYRGKYYLFVTFTSRQQLGKVHDRPAMVGRGTQILVADSPEGPFKPFGNRAHTPAGWLALDGTLWVEDGVPWMVFCHDWTQIQNGTMDLVRLKDDLSDPAGDPVTLFKATDAPWVRSLKQPGGQNHGYVTDAPFLYRTKSGTLLMTWSSFGVDGYALAVANSKSGKIQGPWVQDETPLFKDDGGHGMVFRTFDDKLILVLHQPNSKTETARLFELEDAGDTFRFAGRK